MTAPSHHHLRATRLALALSLTLAAASAAQAQAALSFTSQSGAFLDGNTRMLGWQFSVPAAVSVTALGWFDLGGDGLNREHEVGIWDSATQALVATAVVPQGSVAALSDHFRWIGLSAPVALQPGVNYRVAGLDVTAGFVGDGHIWDANIGFGVSVGGFAVNPVLTLGAPGSALGGLVSSFGYPTGIVGDPRQALMGPNLMLSPVPEPAAWALMLGGVGALLLHRRQRR